MDCAFTATGPGRSAVKKVKIRGMSANGGVPRSLARGSRPRGAARSRLTLPGDEPVPPFPEGSGGGRSPGRRKTGADDGDRTRIPEFRGQILSLLCIPVPPRPLEVPQPSADCGCRGSITRFQGRTICRRTGTKTARVRAAQDAAPQPAAGRMKGYRIHLPVIWRALPSRRFR